MASCIVDAAMYDQDKESRMSSRRFNKHVAERKRRARINTALDELKSMILDGMNKDPEEFEKMEKADILDLTVKFLRAAKQQKKNLPRPAPVIPQQQQAAATAAYAAGYNQSLNQVQRFVSASDLDHATAARLAAHLRSRSVAMTSSASVHQRVVLSHPAATVKRCDPSPRLCRNISREISGSALVTSLQDMRSGATSRPKLHPAVNHRSGPAHHHGVNVNVWRPWEGQVVA